MIPVGARHAGLGFGAALHDAGAAAQRVEHRRRPLRLGHAVVVGERHERGAGEFERGVAAGGGPAVLVEPGDAHREARRRGAALQVRPRVVFRRVVDDHHFEARGVEILRFDGGEQSG